MIIRKIKEGGKEFLNVLGNIFSIIPVIPIISSILGGLGAVFLFSSEKFKNFITSKMSMDDTAFCLLFWLLMALIFAIAVIIFGVFFVHLKCKKNLYILPSSNNKRINAIKKLDNNANKSIYIMGIGLSNVASTFDELKKALKKRENMHIIVLMIDDQIVMKGKNYLVPSDGKDITFCEYIFNTYNVSLSDARANQIKKIKELIEERKNERGLLAQDGFTLKGKVELRKYSSFLPMNITIADKDDEKSKIIVEYIMPFDTGGNRIRLEINKYDYKSEEIKKVAANTKEIINRLMKESVLIIDDYTMSTN